MFTLNQINLMTWNATGVMSSASYLVDTINNKAIDVCGISEHWLYDKKLHILNSLDTKYKSHSVSDLSLQIDSKRKVGKGGVAILWHSKLDSMVSPIEVTDNRIIGIELLLDSSNYYFIFQVYLPCKNYPVSKYKDYIEKIENIVSIYSSRGTIIIMGDMNSKVYHSQRISNSRLFYLSNFLTDFNLCSINTLDFCSGASTSHVNYNGQSESLIDHIILPVEKVDLVIDCSILDDDSLNVSNHRPIVCTIKLPTIRVETRSSCSINWRNVRSEWLDNYQQNFNIDENVNNLFKYDIATTNDIDVFYDAIVLLIRKITNKCISKSKFKHCLKPYWNKELTEAHKCMKYKRRVWVSDGKPRGDIF